MEAKDLIGKDLTGFRIIEMTEVYRIDDDRRSCASLGFFKSLTVAEAFAGVQTDANWHKVRQVPVLTDGIVGFIINTTEKVKLFDDEKEVLAIKEKALTKLSPAERRIFNLS